MTRLTSTQHQHTHHHIANANARYRHTTLLHSYTTTLHHQTPTTPAHTPSTPTATHFAAPNPPSIVCCCHILGSPTSNAHPLVGVAFWSQWAVGYVQRGGDDDNLSSFGPVGHSPPYLDDKRSLKAGRCVFFYFVFRSPSSAYTHHPAQRPSRRRPETTPPHSVFAAATSTGPQHQHQSFIPPVGQDCRNTCDDVCNLNVVASSFLRFHHHVMTPTLSVLLHQPSALTAMHNAHPDWAL
jgi:hypothetical protein